MYAYPCYVTSLNSRDLLGSHPDQVQIISVTVINKQRWQAGTNLSQLLKPTITPQRY